MNHFISLLLLCCATVGAAEPALTLNPIADATLSSNGGGPGGNNPTMRLMSDGEKHRCLLFFEFKDNAARPCNGAVLRMTTDKCWPNEKLQHIRVHRLLRPFDEKSASWQNNVHEDTWFVAGGDADPVAICARRLTKDDNGGGKNIDFDITPLVQAWQNKAWPNYGLMLTLDDGSDSNVHFHSREAANDAKPKLMLYYGAAAPKNADMISTATLKPLGPMPQGKMDLMSSGDSKGTVGKPFKIAYYGKGGIAPYTFKATGVPEGLTLNDSTGELAGSPAKAGTFPMALTITGMDKKSVTIKLNLVVQDAELAAKPGNDGDAKGGSKAPPDAAKPPKPADE